MSIKKKGSALGKRAWCGAMLKLARGNISSVPDDTDLWGSAWKSL